LCLQYTAAQSISALDHETGPRQSRAMAFPITAASPIQFTAPLPVETDVAIIGGGIIGVMTAWFLAKRGIKSVVLEKGRVSGEQSSRNWGWIRQQGRDAAELPIMIEAGRIWQGLEEECGESFGFKKTGVLYLANAEKELAGFEDWLAIAKAHQLDTRLLSEAEVSAMLPGSQMRWSSGMWTPSDARAEPWLAVPALARAAQRMGVTTVEDCAVRAIDLQGGRLAGLITERGRIGCSQAVLAGGVWSSLFLRNHGVELPQLSVRATVAQTRPMPEIFPGAATDEHLSFRRRQDGGYTLAAGGSLDLFVGPDSFRRLPKYLPQLWKSPFGTKYVPAAPRHYPDAWGTKRNWTGDDVSPFEKMRVLDPAPSLNAVRRMQDRFAAAFPALGRPEINTAWAGMIDAMPDTVPVIDRAPSIPGLIIATGMSGHGFGIGPGVGRVVADMAMGMPAGHDLTRFRFSRFSDGSKIELGPSL
jgi:glycine/D-amino acid oxidase-like deaminating enzyme